MLRTKSYFGGGVYQRICRGPRPSRGENAALGRQMLVKLFLEEAMSSHKAD